jgi:DeoR/GlpR family transcriptional regulator of sugar metabolism
MAENARRIIVLTESEKFFHQGVEGLVRIEHTAAVFTDDKIPVEIDNFLTERQVDVYKVPSVRLSSPMEEESSSKAS